MAQRPWDTRSAPNGAREDGLSDGAPKSAYELAMERLRTQLGASDMVLWGGSGQPMATAGASRFDFAPSRPPLAVLRTVCACRFDLSAIDALRDQGPMVIAANHPSLLDAVLITSRLPNAVCFMKADIMDNPLFGAGARMARYVRNDHLIGAIQSCRRELQQGAQIVIFPEGTRTRGYPGNPLNPLTRSTALIATRANVPVQTLIVEFSSPYLGKGWPLWRKPSLPLTCHIRLGRRFAPPRDARLFTQELEAYFRAELTTASTPAASSVAA